MIKITNLNKDYKNNRGLFGIDLEITKGEAVGFVGINGAGKTTTIRHIMGFLKPDSGSVTVDGKDSWSQSEKVRDLIGYIPGEIAFPNYHTGTEFLKQQSKLQGISNMERANKVMKKLQLDPTANLKRMSKGMKQKTAIVAALMAEKEILILDEPTTGLDPLMRRRFIEMMLEEKRNGKTIFMSSHMFEEVEQICDRVALIENGKIVAIKSVKEIKHNTNKKFTIIFKDRDSYVNFTKLNYIFNFTDDNKMLCTISVLNKDISLFMKDLSAVQIKTISEEKYSLSQYFKDLEKEQND
ncbi:MAG: ABC transporter ATP-binding protein [Mycoplasmatales bacterium]